MLNSPLKPLLSPVRVSFCEPVFVKVPVPPKFASERVSEAPARLKTSSAPSAIVVSPETNLSSAVFLLKDRIPSFMFKSPSKALLSPLRLSFASPVLLRVPLPESSFILSIWVFSKFSTAPAEITVFPPK